MNEDDHPMSEEEGKSEDYVPEPFPEKELEPHGWNNILATLDVCTNELTPTMFCDEEGYDLFPFQMVKFLQHTKEGDKVKILEGEVPARVIQNEISPFEHSYANPRKKNTTTH